MTGWIMIALNVAGWILEYWPQRADPAHLREPWPTRWLVNAQRQRKKVEALFAELKNQIGLRRLRMRRMKFVREQFFLAAAAQKHQAVGPLPQSGAPTAARRDGLVSNPCKETLILRGTHTPPTSASE